MGEDGEEVVVGREGGRRGKGGGRGVEKKRKGKGPLEGEDGGAGRARLRIRFEFGPSASSMDRARRVTMFSLMEGAKGRTRARRRSLAEAAWAMRGTDVFPVLLFLIPS